MYIFWMKKGKDIICVLPLMFRFEYAQITLPKFPNNNGSHGSIVSIQIM